MHLINSLKTTIALTCIIFQSISTMEQQPIESKQQQATLEQELGLSEPATLKFRTAYNLIKQGTDLVKSDLPNEVKEYVQQLEKMLQKKYLPRSSKLIFFNLLNNPNHVLNVDALFPNKTVTEKQEFLDNALCDGQGDYFIGSLVKAGANPDGKCLMWTMLIAASAIMDVPKVLALLNNNSDINQQTPGGDTALIWASDDSEKLDVLKILLAQSADINIQNKFGFTALITAASRGNTEGVRLLLEAGADKTKVGNNMTALEWALLRGFTPIINLLSLEDIHEKYPSAEKLGVIEPTLVFRSAYTLIKQSTDIGNTNLPTELKTLVNLVKKALDPTIFTPMTRKLLLNFLNNAHFDAEKLISEKSDKSKQEILNEAFKETLLSQDETFTNIVLDAGADANAELIENKEKNKWTTPLIIAVNNNDIALVDRLIRMGASINQPDSFMNTALMAASRKPERIAILKLLLEHSPLIDALDRYGYTALMDAALAGNTEGVQLLIDRGASPNIKAGGQTALDLVTSYDYQLTDWQCNAIANLLRKKMKNS